MDSVEYLIRRVGTDLAAAVAAMQRREADLTGQVRKLTEAATRRSAELQVHRDAPDPSHVCAECGERMIVDRNSPYCSDDCEEKAGGGVCDSKLAELEWELDGVRELARACERRLDDIEETAIVEGVDSLTPWQRFPHTSWTIFDHETAAAVETMIGPPAPDAPASIHMQPCCAWHATGGDRGVACPPVGRDAPVSIRDHHRSD